MKKIIVFILSFALIASCLSACSSGAKDANKAVTDNSTSKKLQIVTTIFPEYDWVMNVLGETSKDAEVTMLLGNGVDLHSYQPTTDDILKISTCDLFIYVGGESDEWVKDALKNSQNNNRVTLNLLDILGEAVKEEEVVEGMQAEEEHDHEEEDHEHDEEEVEYDEHVWLSLKNAEKITDAIKDSLAKLDTANAGKFTENANTYIEKLKAQI